MVELMQNAKALICPLLPPYGEIFGLSTVEAMAAGTPVISTNCGAAKELIIEGQTGFVIPSVTDLSSAVQKLDTLIPSHCIARAQFFDRARMAKDYVALYERMMRSEPW
jgi:glycosyltransferase involved in cell wall biosynthesis